MATYVVNCIWIILGFKRKRPILMIVDTTFSNQWVCRSWLGQPISCVELNSWLIGVDFQITSWFRVYNSEITWNKTLNVFFWTTHISLNCKLHLQKNIYIFFITVYKVFLLSPHRTWQFYHCRTYLHPPDITLNHPYNSTASCYQHMKNLIFCFYLKEIHFWMLL